MTANVIARDVDACLAAGADAHVGKPFVPADLEAVVAEWAGTRRREPATASARREAIGAHDPVTFATIVDMAGASTVASRLNRLSAELDGRLTTTPSDGDGWRTLGSDAHTLVSSAGMLGFTPLSDACRTWIHLCTSDPG